MSRNGTGTYSLPAGNPVVTGTTITSTWANNTLTDIASALTDSVAADGQTPMTGDLDLNTNKVINLDPGTVAGNAVEYDQFVNATTTAVNITGGTINGTTIGETTRSSGKFTTLQANAATTLTSTLDVTGVATFAANSQFNGTGALKLPVGTTGQQPTPVAGMIRYNSTTTLFEGYGTTWASLGGGAAGSNTQVQYNNGGVLAGSSALTFNGTTLQATAANATTLQVTTLNAPSGVLATQNGMTGICKAWVNFDAVGTVTIRSSFNVSSITDDGTGLYTVNFTTAMPNANYAAIASTRRNATADGTGENNVNNGVNFRGLSTYTTAFTTSAVQICSGPVTNEGLQDFDYVAVAVFSS